LQYLLQRQDITWPARIVHRCAFMDILVSVVALVPGAPRAGCQQAGGSCQCDDADSKKPGNHNYPRLLTFRNACGR
jgi:hypothetical protein